MAQFKGKVAWFSPTKGFGFITREEGPDVFVHRNAIRGAEPRFLEDGAEVEFEVSGPKGLQVECVTQTR